MKMQLILMVLIFLGFVYVFFSFGKVPMKKQISNDSISVVDNNAVLESVFENYFQQKMIHENKNKKKPRFDYASFSKNLGLLLSITIIFCLLINNTVLNEKIKLKDTQIQEMSKGLTKSDSLKMGLFNDNKKAEQKVFALKLDEFIDFHQAVAFSKAYDDSFIIENDGYFEVLLGGFSSLAAAKQYKESIDSYASTIIEVPNHHED